MTLKTMQGSALDGKLARALKRRKAGNPAAAHSDRRRGRFEDEYRSIYHQRYGKRDGFGLRSSTTNAA